jgi:hypothetical protein
MGLEDRDIVDERRYLAEARTPIPWDAKIDLYMPGLGWREEEYLTWIQWGVMPAGVTWYQRDNDIAAFDEWGQNAEHYFLGTGQFAARGGGGRAGPTYERPDESLVRQAVEGAQNSLVGVTDAAEVDRLMGVFYSGHKANFNNKGQQIDAMSDVLDEIRNTQAYKEIHAARPSSVDETTWISSRVGKLMAAGISAPLAAELGIEQATAASGDETLLRAGEARQFSASGRMLQSHKRKMREPLAAAMQLL